MVPSKSRPLGGCWKNSLDLYIMKEVFDFLAQLSRNNNREWFNANKETYLQVREKFEDFAGQLIGKIAGWDEDIANSNLQVKDCTYRMYRDTRFSKDKVPYKTHMGIFICKGGKKSPNAGYYLHLEPPANYSGIQEIGILPDMGEAGHGEGECPEATVPADRQGTDKQGTTGPSTVGRGTAGQGTTGQNASEPNIPGQKGVHTQTPLSMGGCFIIAGTYRYESKVLRSIRDEISVNGDSFLEAMEQAQQEGFYPEESQMLRKVPAEFSFAPDKWHTLLRYKTFALIKPVGVEYVCTPDALDNIAGDFRKCSNYLRKLNMAIEYAYEEEV